MDEGIIGLASMSSLDLPVDSLPYGAFFSFVLSEGPRTPRWSSLVA